MTKKSTDFRISAIPYIHHFNIYEELEALFGLPVTIENDANCAGLAEIYEGAAKGKKKCFLSLLGQELAEQFFAMVNCTKALIYMEASLTELLSTTKHSVKLAQLSKWLSAIVNELESKNRR